MSPHQTIAVAVRLFAVWLVIYVARDMLALYLEGNKQHDPHSFWIATFVSVLGAAFCLILWLFPRSVARTLLSNNSRDTPSTSSPDLWLGMGCALIGLWLLTSAVPALIRNSWILLLYRSDADTSSLRLSYLYYVPEVLIAIWLILGAKGFRKVFWSVRNAGREEPSNSSSSGREEA
jgi:hypothetical protein